MVRIAHELWPKGQLGYDTAADPGQVVDVVRGGRVVQTIRVTASGPDWVEGVRVDGR